MKKIYFFLLLCCVPFLAKSQCGAQFQTMPTTCFGNCDGGATVFPFGGVAPYSYLWAPGGQTTQTITNQCAGTYTVTVSDANGCITTGSCVITSPTQIMVATAPTNASCSTCCDGNIVSTVTGGTPPYFYTWSTSPVQNTPTAQSLCPGTYTLCVTDANGCVVCQTATVNFTTGIIDLQKVNQVSAYPNPVSSSVTLTENFEKPCIATITIVNMLGEELFAKKVSAGIVLKENIDLTSYPAGTYFISVQTNSGISVQRIIKE